MKKILLLFCLFLLVACSKKEPITTPVQDEDIHLQLIHQYKSKDNDSKIEMMLFDGDIPNEVKKYNDELADTFTQYVRVYGENDEYFCQLYNYPITNENYINLTYIVNILPAYVHYDYGHIHSVSYDINAKKLIKEDDALSIAKITKEQLEEELKTYVEKYHEEGIGIKSIGFYIEENRDVHFIISYEVMDGVGEHWGNFYEYCNGIIKKLDAYPFEIKQIDQVDDLFYLDEQDKIASQKFTIHYELDQGENHEDNPDSYYIFSPEIQLEGAKKKGYVFDGWYLDKDFTQPINKIQRGSINDLTLYAKYKEGTYTVKYVLDGGINDLSNPTLMKDRQYTLHDPIKKGYEFIGWYSDAKFINKITVLKNMNEDVTLYAKWKEIQYPIHYILDDGLNGNNPASYTITTIFDLLPASKEGYTFEGWFSDPQFNHRITTIEKGSTEEKTLYAYFTKNEVIEQRNYFDENSLYAMHHSNATAILVNEKGTIDGISGTYISVGEDSEERFVAWDHYFVSDNDETIYQMDILTGDYVKLR